MHMHDPDRKCDKCKCPCHCYADVCPTCANDVCEICDCGRTDSYQDIPNSFIKENT